MFPFSLLTLPPIEGVLVLCENEHLGEGSEKHSQKVLRETVAGVRLVMVGLVPRTT